MFNQQYSKIGRTREQLFHTWRFFHFDENTETIDAYVNHIRQVATLLGYQVPQILEVFKNAPYIIRTLEVGQSITLIAEVIMVIRYEVIRGM